MPVTVATYVRELDRALVGPRRVRRSLLRESEDHLVDAATAYREAGYDVVEAEDLATRDFGSVADVAEGFQTTLAVAASRRSAWLLAATLLLQPLLWDGPVGLVGSGEAPPSNSFYTVLDVGVEYLGLLLILTTAGALVATGIGNRWRLAGRHTARMTARFTVVSSVLLPTLAVSMTVASGQSAEPAMWLAVTVFMLLPMALTAHSARRCLAAC